MALLTETGLRINRYCSMADFPFFKMAAVRHLGFLKVGNFNFRSRSEAQYASACQISRRSVKPCRRYGRFSIFQDGGRPPSWICFTRVGTEEYLVVFMTVQNLVVIGAVISIVCKFQYLFTFICHEGSKKYSKIKNRQTYSTYTIMAYTRKHIHKKFISITYKNSSGDEIANVNFLRRYGTYVLQNTKKENLLRLTN